MKMSVVSNSKPIDNFVYHDFSVKKAIGDVPQLNFEIEIEWGAVSEIKYIYINHLDCEVELRSTDKPEYGIGRSDDGHFGTFTINVGKLIEIGKSEKIHLIIPLNSPKVDKFLDLRHKKRYLIFEIRISGHCLCYDSEYNLKKQIPIKDYDLKTLAKGELHNHVLFSTDDFNKLMKQVKGYSLENVEIPIYEFKEQRFPSMKTAVELLNSAHQNLYSGKELEMAKDIRNLLESITKVKMVNTDKGKIAKKFLRSEIKKYLLEKVPESSKETYKKVINELQKDIRAIYSVLSRFIHETDDKLIAVPLHRDLEFLYLSTLAIIIYLAKHLE